MNTTRDEEEIRSVIATWMRATAEGDLPTILDLMSEDVVFLLPGQPPMKGRDAFAAGFKMALEKFRIEGKSDIQEISITGDYAYCWNDLTITLVPLQGGPSKSRAGNVLSVFRREPDGKWRIFRDANLLTEA